MKKKKQLWSVPGMIFVLLFSGCAKDAAQDAAQGVPQESREETEIAEEKLPEEESPEAEEEKKINYTKFEDLSLAAEQVGFSFRAIEGTEDAYFSNFLIKEEQGKDEEGNAVGDPYPVVTLQYKDNTNKLDAFIITIYPVQGETEQPPTYVSTEEIEGVPVSLTDYVIRFVLQDYELTEEDWEFINSGKGNYSVDGVTEGGESHHRSMYWQEDGIFYKFESRIPDMPVETLREGVRAVITAEFR